MKTRILLLTLCATLLCMPCIAEQAATAPLSFIEASAGEATLLMRAAKEVHLRKRPGTDQIRLDTLLRHTQVEVLGVETKDDVPWAHVRVLKNGKQGYVLMSLLEAIPEPTPTPTVTPKPTQAPTPIPSPTPAENAYAEPVIMRTTVRANLRRQPNGRLIREIAKGEHLSVLAETLVNGELWYRVRYNDQVTGYMLGELLQQIRPVMLVPLDEAFVRDRFPVVSRDPIADARAADLPDYTQEDLEDYVTLRVGTRNQHVLNLKRRLYEMGYYTKPNENKNYTNSTADVIKIFQRDVGLPITGVADPLTQAALFDDRTPKREGSPQADQYLSNDEQPLRIQRTDITSYNYHGSVQLSLRNNSGAKLTAFGLKIIPYMSDGSVADMAPTFAQEIEREYSVSSISIPHKSSYSDFVTNGKTDEGIWPHHFLVSHGIYFSGAQIAVSWYRSGGKTVYVDDDQMVFVAAGDGAQENLIHTLPIVPTDQEIRNADWELGVVTRYILPVYQEYYGLPQGAWIKSIEENSPAADAGLMEGDIIVGIGDVTILGDATLRQIRGRIAPGASATIAFWRDGQYYATELIRPEK